MGETTARATNARAAAARATSARIGEASSTPFDVVVRPRAALLRSTALSIALSAVPLAVALIWVSFPLRMWAVVATFVVLCAVFTAVIFVRLRTAFVGVGSSNVEFRGLLGGSKSVSRAMIDRVVTGSTFTNSVDRLTREFVALDIGGRPVLRLRGVLWDEAAIAQVVAALGVQSTDHAKPMPLRDFLQSYPDDRPWVERRSAAVATILAVGGIVALVLAAEVSGAFAR